MRNPPFKLAPQSLAASGAAGAGTPWHGPGCCQPDEARTEEEPPPVRRRSRLSQLDSHLHCSIVGTCLSAHDVRRFLSPFVAVDGRTEIDLHHDAVSLAGQGGAEAKALHKLLDARHEAALRRFDRCDTAAALLAAWTEANRQGDVAGAYWAVLTHPDSDDELRRRAFGEVHMLSHLAGSAQRADTRRLHAVEAENAELRRVAEREQARSRSQLAQRDAAIAQLHESLRVARLAIEQADRPVMRDETPVADQVAVQTARRERAEQALAAADEDRQRLATELEFLRAQQRSLQDELAAAEAQLRAACDGEEPAIASPLAASLQGRRILYVGGRPSSGAAIRGLVERHGGELLRHDGGLEDRKGLLAAAVSSADLVVFPVDCIDHDSAGQLKRLCTKQGIDFLPLRSASVTSFAAALSGRRAAGGEGPGCLRA